MKYPNRPLPFVLCASNQGSMIVNRQDYRMVSTATGYGVGYQLLNNACFDPDEVSFVSSLLSERRATAGDGVRVIDCGANIGVHTVEWSRQMTGWGEVLAIEAQERLYYALAGNIALNNCFNARAIHAAVGATKGLLTVPRPNYNSPASFGSLELQKKANTEFIGQQIDYRPENCDQIRMVSIDEIATARVDFIKIDVEGMELDVLEGAQATIARCYPILFVEVIKTDKVELESRLTGLGYQLFPVGINVLAVHRSDPLAGKITVSAQPSAIAAPAPITRAFELHQAGRLDEARSAYESILVGDPKNFDALHLLGVLASGRGDFALAEELYSKATVIKPDSAECRYNRGIALFKLHRNDAALASYEEAIRLKPDYAQAHSNRATVLRHLNRLDEALASCDQAVAIQPSLAEAHSTRGNVLMQLGRLEESVASYDQAISIKANNVKAISNRSQALLAQKNLVAAVAGCDQAIALDPNFAEAYWNKSLALLLQGNFSAGLPLYEWRWKNPQLDLVLPNLRQPMWLGKESLKGKTIFLHSEQGLGDTLQFIRYAPMVSALGARVVVCVQTSLLGILSGVAGVSEWLGNGASLPKFDFHCPLLSLPLACGTTVATIPNQQAYLKSDPERVAAWRTVLGDMTKPRIGIVWSGAKTHNNDRLRSINLSTLAAHLPKEFEYVSLQKEIRDGDREALAAHPHIKHFGDALRDFSDTAALCELMDVVVSVDTSVAHLSGALGKPTWILLPNVPDWRWLLDRDDSPWYPSVRLYRQGDDSAWPPVLERVRSDLLARVHGRA
jgi:FkbM family methyltransferase